MKIARCPCCHSNIHLEAIVQDKAASDLLGLFLDTPEGFGRSLVVYLGLFRSSKRDLANDRALKLANEVLELEQDKHKLGQALNEVVQSMRLKQDQGVFKPLTNHNYLKRVIETVEVNLPAIQAASIPALNNGLSPVKSQSKAAQTIELLKNYPVPTGMDDWFVRTVCGSLAELMIMSLEGVPAADTMPLVVERFLNDMWPKRNWQLKNHFTNPKRIHSAIIQTAESNQRWPLAKDILASIPKL